jgi:hypothetical protein
MLADCFEPEETGIPTKLIDTFWPAKKDATAEPDERKQAV